MFATLQLYLSMGISIRQQPPQTYFSYISTLELELPAHLEVKVVGNNKLLSTIDNIETWFAYCRCQLERWPNSYVSGNRSSCLSSLRACHEKSTDNVYLMSRLIAITPVLLPSVGRLESRVVSMNVVDLNSKE